MILLSHHFILFVSSLCMWKNRSFFQDVFSRDKKENKEKD